MSNLSLILTSSVNKHQENPAVVGVWPPSARAEALLPPHSSIRASLQTQIKEHFLTSEHFLKFNSEKITTPWWDESLKTFSPLTKFLRALRYEVHFVYDAVTYPRKELNRSIGFFCFCNLQSLGSWVMLNKVLTVVSWLHCLTSVAAKSAGGPVEEVTNEKYQVRGGDGKWKATHTAVLFHVCQLWLSDWGNVAMMHSLTKILNMAQLGCVREEHGCDTKSFVGYKCIFEPFSLKEELVSVLWSLTLPSHK